MPGGPPGAIVVVQRGSHRSVHAGGVAQAGAGALPTVNDYMRIASVSKAFNGATALALVSEGVLSLGGTLGQRLPDLPEPWGKVTLHQLLDHTSGLPDFTTAEGWVKAATTSPGTAPAPAELLRFVGGEPLVFPPGSRYAYSNSDNVAVSLMIEAVTGRGYADVLTDKVLGPLGLKNTSLPAGTEMPDPIWHGYAFDAGGKPHDQSFVLAAGFSQGSGGMVSTPADLNDFLRGYVDGKLFDDKVRTAQQQQLIPGSSLPPGPGKNSAGMALDRYDTEVRHRLRPHRQHLRIHPGRCRITRWPAVDNRVDLIAAQFGQQGSGRHGLHRPPRCRRQPSVTPSSDAIAVGTTCPGEPPNQR